MPYKDPEDARKRAKRHCEANKDYYANKFQRHKRENPKKHAYYGQKHTAKQRAIPFKMTFEEWEKWWGDDFELRGRGPFQLCMCRYGDRGSYELGNIYKATNQDNKMGPREKDEGLHDDIPF